MYEPEYKADHSSIPDWSTVKLFVDQLIDYEMIGASKLIKFGKTRFTILLSILYYSFFAMKYLENTGLCSYQRQQDALGLGDGLRHFSCATRLASTLNLSNFKNYFFLSGPCGEDHRGIQTHPSLLPRQLFATSILDTQSY